MKLLSIIAVMFSVFTTSPTPTPADGEDVIHNYTYSEFSKITVKEIEAIADDIVVCQAIDTGGACVVYAETCRAAIAALKTCLES